MERVRCRGGQRAVSTQLFWWALTMLTLSAPLTAGESIRVSNLTPRSLLATVGPLIPRQHRFDIYDGHYAGAEQSTYNGWMQGGTGGVDESSHYGALRSRYQWSLRNGLPVGPATAAGNVYAHGVEMTRAALRRKSGPGSCRMAPHNATHLADIEILLLLEGDPGALECLKAMSRYLGAQHVERDLVLTGPNSDPRSSAILLQVLSIGARHDFPYEARQSWGSTWKQAAATVVTRMSQQIQPDGKVVSLAHKNSGQGDEAFFMNAMLAIELLRWHGFVEPQPAWFDLARRIVDHLIDEHTLRGGGCLPYTSRDGNACASDLAGFYVWPALVLWQETGRPEYQKFALENLDAAGRALLSGVKQFNQTYSTGAQSAEALLSGVKWR